MLYFYIYLKRSFFNYTFIFFAKFPLSLVKMLLKNPPSVVYNCNRGKKISKGITNAFNDHNNS